MASGRTLLQPCPRPRRRSRGEDKYKEPEARSPDGGGDPVGNGDFSSRLHLGTDDRGRQPSGRSPLRSSRTSGAPTSAWRRRTGAKAGPPQNTNAALAARDILGGPPVHTARQLPSGRRGHREPSRRAATAFRQEGGKTRCIREREDMVAFQGGHPPFKGDSPYLCPQPSWAESSPTRSKVLLLRRGDWVPRVMQAGPEQKKPNRRARCMQPPSGYEWPSTFAQTSGRKGG
jgi:hypothetical protein